MPEENKLSLDRRLAAQIVGAYLRNHQVPADQLGSLISTVRQTFGDLAKPAAEAVVERTPAVSIRQSVTPNFVVCLDCGYRGQMLRRHLTTAHGRAVEPKAGSPDYGPRLFGASFRDGEAAWFWATSGGIR
jgi:predicted transcriptional regulator